MSSETVAKAVGKKLRYYFEVKRLEDGFDLSGVTAPQLNHPPLKSRATLQYDGLHDRALKHYFSQPEVKTRLTQLSPDDEGDRQGDMKRLLKRYMYKHRFIIKQAEADSGFQINQPAKIVGLDRDERDRDDWRKALLPPDKHPTMPEWMYKYHPKKGKVIKPEFVGFGCGLKSQKKKQIKGGFPVLRTVPSQKITQTEAHRLIDIATKVLVASEKVHELQSRPVTPASRQATAPQPFEKKKRPSTAKYTWDIHGRRQLRIKELESSSDSGRPQSEKRRAYDDSFIPDWIMKQQKEERPRSPSPRLVVSPRPKSAKFRQREIVPLSPKATVINVPEPSLERDVTVNQGSQTTDAVGIQTEKRLLEDYDHTEDEVKDGPRTQYQVYVRTGDTIGASTKADVRVTLYGEKGRSREITLGKSERNKVRFQRGKEDLFLFAAHHVGKLRKIKIGHDRQEMNFAWFLDGASVYDMTDKRIYDFELKDWISGQDGDRQTYRTLTLQSERAFVEAYDDIRGRESPKAGKDRRKDDNSSEGKAPKDDKRSMESIKGSRGEQHDDDYDSSTSYTSSSSSSSGSPEEQQDDDYDSSMSYTSSSSLSLESRKKGGRKSPSPPPRTKTPTRELSPPRKREPDDFFDKPSGPTFTFRSYSEDGKTAEEEYLSGYKAGLDAANNEKKQMSEKEGSEKKRMLNGMNIHDAARTGNLERMQQLISYYPEMKESKDETGLTPLHISAQLGRLDIVKWLTALTINLNTETRTGYTAIHLAAMNGHVNCLIVLAAMGATITSRSVDRQTPLHVAAMNGHLECVKWLIANRSSLNAEDQLGRMPLDLAVEYQHQECAKFIRKCLEESTDPSSSLHALRMSSRGLDPIKEDSSSREGGVWQNDTNPDSARADAGSESESRSSRSRPETMERKRQVYNEHHMRMERTNTSFLDSIRNEATH